MELDERPDQDVYALEIDGGMVEFDTIESTGYGYWELLKDGNVVMKLTSIEELSQEDTQLFRDIQFNR